MIIIITPLEIALKKLIAGLKRAELNLEDDLIRDAVIQRFEYTFELCWKMLKRQLEKDSANAQEIDAYSFKELIREAAEKNLIDDAEAWFMYRNQRNLTSHIYDEKIAKSVFETVKIFIPAADKLLERLKIKNHD